MTKGSSSSDMGKSPPYLLGTKSNSNYPDVSPLWQYVMEYARRYDNIKKLLKDVKARKHLSLKNVHDLPGSTEHSPLNSELEEYGKCQRINYGQYRIW